MSTDSLLIRPYRISDRNAVRQLAYDTADAGNPSKFPDPRLQMDILTRYYTDHEPESLWVVEHNGIVKGYLTGCLDTMRFLRWLNWRGHALALVHLVFRNLFRPFLWRWAQARIRTLREGGAHRPQWVKDYPAHLHLNLSQDLRGKGIARQLLDRFIAQCRAVNIPGIHLTTLETNVVAQRLFSRNGFEQLATINAYRPADGGFERVMVLVMGKKCPPLATNVRQ